MIWNKAIQHVKKGNDLILLVVVDSKGSSPGRQGFKMIVSEDGSLYGSVGGGIMEHKLVELAREMIQKGPHVMLKNQVHGDAAPEESSGMICAGSQRVALLKLDDQYLSTLEQIDGHKGLGSLMLSPAGLRFEKVDVTQGEEGFSAGEDWVYREFTGKKGQLYIFGGGHVSLAVCKLFSDLDFYIRVFDNREMELSTVQENTYADEISIIDYGEAEDHVTDGPNHYVIIMTAGHEFDGLILEQMMSKKLRYLGMMGSRKKVESIFNVLRKTGLEDSDFDRVHAPIGMDIKSETPMEIAVSIAAEIIRLKNN